MPDLARFMITHMNQGEINGVQLLKPENVELMHEKISPYGYMWHYGLGWITYNGIQGHDGALPGFIADMRYRKVEQGSYGVVMMVNCWTQDSAWIDSYYNAIRDLLLEEAARMASQYP